MAESKVRCLLIGGQACVIYGAKTSTVDLDITILTTARNVKNLLQALELLEAKPSPASVPVKVELLARGHSLHYYCEKKGPDRIRFGILGKLPRLAPFEDLWKRRYECTFKSGIVVPILSIPDLIASKKTGRIKDAADITSLINSHYVMNHLDPDGLDIKLWLMEAREVDVIINFVKSYPTEARRLLKQRPLLKYAL